MTDVEVRFLLFLAGLMCYYGPSLAEQAFLVGYAFGQKLFSALTPDVGHIDERGVKPTPPPAPPRKLLPNRPPDPSPPVRR